MNADDFVPILKSFLTDLDAAVKAKAAAAQELQRCNDVLEQAFKDVPNPFGQALVNEAFTVQLADGRVYLFEWVGGEAVTVQNFKTIKALQAESAEGGDDAD